LADVAELIREILERDGHAVDHVLSGEAALERLARRAYTLVLTDLNMPGLGGRGFYEAAARQSPALAHRIAFVTGDTMSPFGARFPRWRRLPLPGEAHRPGRVAGAGAAHAR
jgi:CheY-like chemotaxis protein